MRIDANNFPIAFVFEEKALDILGNDLIVWCVIRGNHLILPIVKAQIGRFGQELFLAIKIGLKIFRFQTMSVVDIARYLLAFRVLISNKYY